MEFGINYFCSVCERRFEDNAQLKACSECKQVYYCCKDHQREDWKKHKPKCKNVRTAERTGVVLKSITPGDGKTFPLPKQKVWVHYIGTFINGRQFDSSVSRQTPFSFIVGTQQVIRGWDVAITQMTLKEYAELTIGPQLAYGSKGYGTTIPPNTPLLFYIKLLRIEKVEEEKEKLPPPKMSSFLPTMRPTRDNRDNEIAQAINKAVEQDEEQIQVSSYKSAN